MRSIHTTHTHIYTHAYKTTLKSTRNPAPLNTRSQPNHNEHILSINVQIVQLVQHVHSIRTQAHELSILTGTDVLLLVASETGHIYTFSTRKLKPIITNHQVSSSYYRVPLCREGVSARACLFAYACVLGVCVCACGYHGTFS